MINTKTRCPHQAISISLCSLYDIFLIILSILPLIGSRWARKYCYMYLSLRSEGILFPCLWVVCSISLLPYSKVPRIISTFLFLHRIKLHLTLKPRGFFLKPSDKSLLYFLKWVKAYINEQKKGLSGQQFSNHKSFKLKLHHSNRSVVINWAAH